MGEYLENGPIWPPSNLALILKSITKYMWGLSSAPTTQMDVHSYNQKYISPKAMSKPRLILRGITFFYFLHSESEEGNTSGRLPKTPYMSEAYLFPNKLYPYVYITAMGYLKNPINIKNCIEISLKLIFIKVFIIT